MEGYTARYELNGVNNTVTENAELHQPFVWTRKSTALLIQLYKERLLRFRDPKQMKRSLWGEIVKKFEEHGYKGLNEDIVDRKFRNMKKTFRTITEKKISTGQGRVAWEYFDDFVEIFEEDRTLNFGHFFSTMEPSSQPPIVSSQPYSCATTVTSNQASTSYASSSSSPSPDPIIPSTEMTDVQPNDVEFLKNPSTSTEKYKRGKKLNEFRKKQLELEEKRVAELSKLRQSVEKSNLIQAERNELLKKILEKM